MASNRLKLKYNLSRRSSFQFKPFTSKQLKILTWWSKNSPHSGKKGIICDGAVRSGKTLLMSLSFVMWAMANFDGYVFGMAGKTVSSFRRNVIFHLVPILRTRGYQVEDLRTDNMLIIRFGETINYFHIFGGRDERSQDLVQGLTCAGFFMDEVALMPESFVNQAIARCSEEGSKLWFNCNPQGPKHWFKSEFINKRKDKNLYRLHFLLEDNPSLSEETINMYKNMFTGIFYKRYILGLWVLSDGAVYDMWNDDIHTFKLSEMPEMFFISNPGTRYISIDYGTANPTVFLDIHDDGHTVRVVNEYYHGVGEKDEEEGQPKVQKTSKEYLEDLIKFIEESPINDIPVTAIIIDPSALSFKVELRTAGFRIKNADNEVLEGIRYVATMIKMGHLLCEDSCTNFKNEMASYIWNKKKSEIGVEEPLKQNDHAMDAIRYYVKTVIKPRRIGGEEAA